jgi:peptidoglycan/LPS O-acetylase OafA/YrhL
LCRLAGPFAGSWATFFYLGDYYTALTHHYSMLTQAWSLGVEEKFYLLWPFALTRIKRENLTKVLLGVLIFEPLYRMVLCLFGFRTYTWFAFDTHLDAIVLGCVIAIWAKRGWTPPRWMGYRFTPICALIGVFLFQGLPDLVPYLLAVLLVSVICRPTVVLNNPLARYFGAISYSLYLCHMYAGDILWRGIFRGIHFHHALLPVVSQLAIAVLLASALHFTVERPFLKLKNRFHAKNPVPRGKARKMFRDCLR